MITEKIKTILNSLADDIRQRMAENDENATYRTSKSLEVKESENKISLVATAGNRAPIHTLEVGRPAGKRPPIAPLKEWAEAKFGYVGKEASAVAWAVSTKIMKEGTERHTNNVDIYSTPKEEAVAEIKKVLFTEIKNEIKSMLKI